MTDRVYPSSKPNGTAGGGGGGATAATANPAPNSNGQSQFAPPKPQMYNPTRHPYRPNNALHARHNRRRCSGRRCFCLCCFWSILSFLILLLLIAIAGSALYVLYRPHRPAYSISSLKFSQFNLTTGADDATRITSKLNFTLSSKNPNKRITFFYNPITINLYSSQVLIANGTFKDFTSAPGDVTILHSTLAMASEVLDGDSVTSLKSDLKRKLGLPLRLEMETKMKVKVEKIKSEKVGIKIVCDGVHGMVPKGNSTVAATVDNARCKVDLRIKIWKFNF